MYLVMFYGISSNVRLVHMRCSIVYLKMFEKYTHDILLNIFLFCVFNFFFLYFVPDFIHFTYVMYFIYFYVY